MISWDFAPKSAHLSWRERDGPQVKSPTHPGFGRIVIERMAGDMFGGTAKLELLPTGVHWSASIPSHSSRPQLPETLATAPFSTTKQPVDVGQSAHAPLTSTWSSSSRELPIDPRDANRACARSPVRPPWSPVQASYLDRARHVALGPFLRVLKPRCMERDSPGRQTS
jgi:hypothetical protein